MSASCCFNSAHIVIVYGVFSDVEASKLPTCFSSFEFVGVDSVVPIISGQLYKSRDCSKLRKVYL